MDCNCEHNNAYNDDLRLVKGNDFATIHNIVAKYPDETVVEDFDLNQCSDVAVHIRRNGGVFKDIETYAETWSILEAKKIRINFDGLKMKNGSYRIDFVGKFQGKDWRCYSDEKGFGIVESNEEANIPADTIIADGVYQILTDFTMTYQTQEQADWAENNTLLPSYIKNKPDLSLYVEKEEGYGLSENDYSDEEKLKVDNAVPNTRKVNGKVLDSDITLTSSDIGALPTSTKYGYSIDLTLNSQDFKLTSTLKDQDGTTLNSKMVDLPLETVVVSGRYDSTNKVIVLTLQNGNPIDIPVGDLVSGLQSEITSSNKLSSDLVDDTNSTNKFVSASEKTSWDSKQDALVSGTNIKTINNQSLLGSGNITIQGGGGGGAIDSISVNGTPQPIDEGNVDITVPTKVSDLTNDSGYITTYTETDPVFAASAAHGITSSNISSWNGKYTKPSSGIPASDIASGVIPDVSQFITKSVNDLANYYTKTQTYTQAEVDALFGAINQFHYEIAESTSAVVSPASNVLYLIGPTGTGADKYEEYVYTTTWVKIGDTSIDLSGYVTTTALNTALSGYQTKIDSNHKLDYSLLSNTPTKVSDFTNDSGFITTETDPTVPSWAKASSKPSYTASEVGAVPTTRTVNGKALSADITLSASDVNALPSSTVIPDAQIQSDWSQADNTKKDYIKNKPTIPAAQVQANWNESDTDSKAYIQNKPTIPAAQVQSNWNESDTNSKAYIQNKPTIPAAGIPSGGNAGQVLTKTDGSTDYAVAWRDTNNIFPSAYCTTAAATAAKGASCTLWTATSNSYLHILLKNANTNQGALSLNVNSTGAAPIYINGTVSSSTNYTLPAGSYIVFYDGTNYYFRTDGKLTANITGMADAAEAATNKVTSLSSQSTDTQYPSAKCVYDLVGDIETLLAAI